MFKNDGRPGTCDYKDAFSVAGAIQETCSSELLGGPGAASFLMLSTSKIEDVSQNSFVFKLPDRQRDSWTER